MIDAFFYLQTRSFANRLKSRLRRLKQPKYLIGAGAGLLYLYLYFFQWLFLGTRAARSSGGLPVEDLGAAILFIIVLLSWIIPHRRSALVFTEAEVAFLFPAPVSRNALIHYKLIRSQTAILFTTLILTLVTGRWLAPGSAGLRVLGWWVILSTLNLHFIGSSFARTLLLDRGISNWLRRIAVVLLVFLCITATYWVGRETLRPPGPEVFAGLPEMNVYLKQLFATPPISWVLWPFRLVVGPYAADGFAGFLKALGPALAVMAVHYFWVVRSNVAFEEASVDLSRRMAERIAAARAGKDAAAGIPRRRVRAPFLLRSSGPSPVAFLWKNLIHAQATFRPAVWLFILLPAIVAGVLLGAGHRTGAWLGPTVAIIALMFLVWSLLIGAQLVRYDLRHDLASMDTLKLLPLRGWAIVLGELLAPAALLTVIQWALLAVLMLASHRLPAWGFELPWPLRLSWAAAVALVVPFWNCLSLLIPNATVLAFPGWFQSRTDAPQGIEVTGQRLILLFGQMFLVGVTVLPAAMAFGLLFGLLTLAGLALLAPLAGALAAIVVLTGEIALGVWATGKLFDRFDVAAEQSV